MHISSIIIKNYRGLNIEINSINDIVTIIGQNDSGKSNICSAIMKVLDYTSRRTMFTETDSTMCNREDIFIKIKLTVDDLTTDQIAQIHEVIHEKDGERFVIMQLTSTFNSDVLLYEDSLLIGDPDGDYKEYGVSKQNPIDKILSVIYINPTYDTKSETKNYFGHKETKHIEDNTRISDEFKEALKSLGEKIKNEEAFSEILNDINDLGNFEKMFDGISFELSPNIRTDNIYKSLEISTLDNKGNVINNIGDGKSKVFSMLLKEKTYDNDKAKIIIVEEPENHLYVLLQKFYVDSLLSFNPSQMIITTHSPHVVDFEKTNQIIKIKRVLDSDTYIRKIFNYNVDNEEFKRYGYLINVEIAEMMYYDTVLLIEGDSEKYFYSLLLSKDETFRQYIFDNRVGIFSVGGIAFRKTKELLEMLGITVYLKTDNDIFKIRNSKKIYAGLTRCISYLPDDQSNILMQMLSLDNLNSTNFEFDEADNGIEIIDKKMDEICNFLFENKILFSNHHDGFEKDFLDYINYNGTDYNEVMEYLKKAKLTNLHTFISDNDIDISIKEENINSILLGFIKNDR